MTKKDRKDIKAIITFTEPLLGTISGNKEITEEFIASKHPDGTQDEEMNALPPEEEVEKATTYFARNDSGKPLLWDYQFKGFLKEACRAMIDMDVLTQEELKKVNLTKWSYKRTIDKLIFVFPRRIPLILPDKVELTFCQRPLRGETMRGERIALARSESAPAGTQIEIKIICLNPKLYDFVIRWLDYGALSGCGQWRNSGAGRFSWEQV